jgi:predicted transcriptional regulator/transcriptional regulator with XRE-family HTH domain
MPRAHIGSKIRERRKRLGRTQAALADEIGISASYLNLIEANKRQVGGHLLQKVAAALEIDADSLDGAAEKRLAEHLHELAAAPLLRSLDITPASAFDLIGRHPQWARALVTAHRALQDQTDLAAALSDRLNHDPFLSDAVHGMLTNVAAIRSAAEILESVDDLDPEQRARFDRIIGNESQRLADVATRLAGYFDRVGTEMRSLTPSEEVDDLLWERSNYFPGLEAAALDLVLQGFDGKAPNEIDLADRLQREHGIEIDHRPEADLADIVMRNDCCQDEAGERLIFTDTAARPTRRFQMARLLAERALADAIDAEVDGVDLLTTNAARQRAARALSSYAAGAMLMPYHRFLEDAIELRYDIERLAHRHQVSFEQACHRLVTLRKPDAAGIPFAFMRADPAGFVTKRFPLPRLPLPRYGHACPLWAVYTAFQTPGTIVRQVAELPSGDRFLFVARAAAKAQAAFQTHRQVISIMLACDSLHADDVTYGDGLNFSAPSLPIPIGPTCRLCPRETCRHREEDPIIGAQA